MKTWLAALLVTLAAAGCTGDLDPAWLVTKPRILGMRNTVGGTERASPAAGETVDIEVLVVNPERADTPLSWTLAGCLAQETTNGAGICEGMPFAFAAQLTRTMGPPGLSVTIPPGTPRGAQLLMLGAVCVDADLEADLAAMDFSCTGGGDPLLVTYRLPIGTENFNPVMADDAILLAGEPWMETPPDAACADLPQARIGDDARNITVSLRGATREMIPMMGNETMVLSTFTTARELERQFSVLEPEQETTTLLALDWTPEEDTDRPIAAGGTVAHFWFVLRDGRGGIDSTTRALCVSPAL